jgi:DNA (cytosine-5)-methyltransferase 1
MAGYEVVYAVEFVEAARDTYLANFPDVFVDERDVRLIQPGDVLKRTGLEVGQLDVLEGSPPCASFSTAGKRAEGWGAVKAYSDTKQRTDDLFFEFVRLLGGLKPRAFVAENVYGLVKGVAKGYFKEIFAALAGCGYRVEARLLDAQWLGVPQARQRVIFAGVREDIGIGPRFPSPFPYRYSLRDVLPHVVRQGANSGFGTDEWVDASSRPSATIGASPQTGNGKCPPSLIESTLLRAVRTKKGLRSLDLPAPTIMTHNRVKTHCELSFVEEQAWLAPYAIGAEWDKLRAGERSEKYFQLEKPSADRPSPTITQRGGDAGVACVTHPVERRKFTIAELRRVCSFPDDFVLTGTYAQQWERLGRSVPPLMMRAVAATLRDEVFARCPKR